MRVCGGWRHIKLANVLPSNRQGGLNTADYKLPKPCLDTGKLYYAVKPQAQTRSIECCGVDKVCDCPL